MKRKFYLYLVCLALLFFYLSTSAQHFGTPGNQTAVYKNVTNGIPYGYYEYLPQNFDVNLNTTQKYPVVIFFGGVGEIGNGTTDLTKMLNPTAPPKLIKNGKHYPAIVISAQHSGWFDEPQSKELYDYITSRYPIDSNRVYVTGLSAGGAATWKFARAYPELPAAIVPIAGATQFKSPQTQMQQVSIWAIHNVGDGYPSGGVPSVFTMYNCDYIANISGTVRQVYPGGWGWGKTAGFDVTMHFMDSSYWDADTGYVKPKQKMSITMFDAFGHNGWGKAYNSQILWDWLFTQTRNNTTNPPPPPPPAPVDSVVVDAGEDKEINLPIGQLKLTGSAYSLINTAISSYNWTKESGPTVTMSGILTPELTLSNLQSGTYVFKLKAATSLGVFNTDLVTVKVNANAAPVANAGVDQFINLPQDYTYLDGSMSYDPESNPLTYQWNLIDSKLYGDTDTTIVTVPTPGNGFKVFVNFTPSWIIAGLPWNNINGSINAGTKIVDMVDDSNTTTNMDLEVIVGWNGSKSGGKTTGNNSGIYPDVVLDGVYWFQNRTPQLQLSDLDTNYTYSFKFFASRTGKGLDKTTVFQIGNKSDSVDAAENTSDVAIIQNVNADNNGEIIIDISTGAGATYGYLNAIEIEAAPKTNTSATSTVITVAPPVLIDSSEYYVNFTTASLQVGSPWNNINGSIYSGTKILGLKDKNGTNSNINIELLTNWNGSKVGGKTTGDDSGVLEDDVLYGFYWFQNNGQQIKVSGLDPNVKYDFSFLGSRVGKGLNKITVFSINGQKDSLNASENTSEMAELNGVSPNANGELIVNVTRGFGAKYGYLNAIVIKAKSGKKALSIKNPNQATTMVEGLSKGTFTFELTVTDNNQLVDKDIIVVNVGSGSSAKLTKNSLIESNVEMEDPKLSIYPNPVANQLNISGEGLNDSQILLFDMQGKMVNIIAEKNNNMATMDVSKVPSGNYIVRIIKGNYSKAVRVVVAPR